MAYDPKEARDENGRWSSGLMDSLKHQLKSKPENKGKSSDQLHALTVEIMQNQGTLDKGGRLTAKGREREAMGHKGRIADRVARQRGVTPDRVVVVNHKGYVK